MNCYVLRPPSVTSSRRCGGISEDVQDSLCCIIAQAFSLSLTLYRTGLNFKRRVVHPSTGHGPCLSRLCVLEVDRPCRSRPGVRCTIRSRAGVVYPYVYHQHTTGNRDGVQQGGLKVPKSENFVSVVICSVMKYRVGGRVRW